MAVSRIVKRYPLSKQVSDKLEQMIEAGAYPVGERVPTEVELMEMFSVSRNTVREAIQSLTSAGVLEVRQGDGTYVRSSNRFNANMNMKYSRESIHDITEARNCLEITIAHLAAQRRSEEDLTEIAGALRKRQELGSATKEGSLADIDFHMAIAKACHNPILIDLYRSLSAYLVDHIVKRQTETEMDDSEIDLLHEKLFLAVRDARGIEAGACAQNILNI